MTRVCSLACAMLAVLAAFASTSLAGMPAMDWRLDDAARVRTATRERVCLNGWWQFHLGDKTIVPAPKAPQGKTRAVLNDFEKGVGAFDPRCSDGGKKPTVRAAKEAKLGRGALRVAVAPQKGGWRTLTQAVKLPSEEFLLSVWVRGVRGRTRFRLRLLERRKDGFEIHCTEPIVLTAGDWGKLTVSLLQMPYYWGSGATDDKALQLANVNELDFLFEVGSDGELLVDQLQLEPLAGAGHPAIPDGTWGAAKVPGRIYPGEFDLHLPDGKLFKAPDQKLPTTGWYRREVALPAAWRGKRVLLDVGHVNQRGFVFVNGRFAGRAGGPLDVTSVARMGEANTVAVYARSTRIGSQWWQRMAWTGGVYGDVWLEARDAFVNVRDVRIITSVARRELAADVELANETDKAVEVQVAATAHEWRRAGLAAKADCTLPTVKVSVAAHGRATARLRAAWPEPKLWTPDTPHLYSLRVQARADRLLDERVERFGFRDFAVREGRFWLNGAPFVFRSETSGLSGGLYTGYHAGFLRRYLRFLRAMNYNGNGFGIGAGASAETFAEACDEVGLVWLPGWNSWSPGAFRRLKNHPSLVGWSTDMWKTLQKWDNQPKKMGTDYFPQWLLAKRAEMLEHEREIRKIDPTRVVLHYGCGNVGDIWCNLPYMGLGVPLQAREEVPRDWSRAKRAALYSAEFDFPFMYNWRDIDSYERKQCLWGGDRYKAGLHHEHGARYFGEAAYGMSKRVWVNWSDGRDEGGDVSELVKRVNELFVRRTVRSWRAYEVGGLGLFGLATGGYAHVVTDFGGFEPHKPAFGSLKTPGPVPDRVRQGAPIRELNSVGEAVRDALSPLLAYVGGHPDFVTKDCAYFADEPIRKQIVLVNGSASDAEVAVVWRLARPGAKDLRREELAAKVPAGRVKLIPITVEPLGVAERTELALHVEARATLPWMDAAADGRLTTRSVQSRDAFGLQVLPRARLALDAGARVALYDPSGKTARMLRQMGVEHARLAALRELKGYGLLVIGREALAADADASELLAAVRGGLSCLCFEQTPDGLLGGALVKVAQRRAFVTASCPALFEGLGDGLADWRGASDLCEPYPEPPPETERTYPEAFWHWSNHGIVCTHALRKPALGSARAILSCGFDLACAPLLECDEGKGRIVFCQLDLTSRYGVDPVATTLAHNLIRRAAAAKPIASRPLAAVGTDRVRSLVRWLGYDAESTAPAALAGLAADRVALLDADALTAADRGPLLDFVGRGGRALVVVPPSAKAVESWRGNARARTAEQREPAARERPAWLPDALPVALGDARIGRIVHPGRDALLDGLAASDFFWRQAYPVRRAAATSGAKLVAAGGVQLLADGLLAKCAIGKGELVLCGIDPAVFHEEWKRETTAQSLAFPKALRIVNRLLANLGARGETLRLRPLQRGTEWREVFRDDFKDASSSRHWRPAGRELKIADGWLQIPPKDGGRNFVLFGRPLANYRLGATVRVVPPGKPLHIILALDYQDHGSYYLFSLTSKGLLLNNMVDGGWGKTAIGPDDPIARLTDTDPHTIQVEWLGSRLTITWDGKVVARTDALVRKERIENAVAQQNGYVGFGSYYNAVHVSKVRIYEPIAGARTLAAGKHTPVDVRRACTVGFVDDKPDDRKGGWFDSGDADLRQLQPGTQTLAGVPFTIVDPAANAAKSCIVLGSQRRAELPKQATVPLGGARARTIYILHGGGWGAGRLATYSLLYQDGTRADLPVRVDAEVGDWYAPFGTPHGGGGSAKHLDPKLCCVAWEGPTPKFDSAGLYALAWRNPHPGKPIRQLAFASADTKGLVGIVAVTLSDAEPDLQPLPDPRRKRPQATADFVPTPLYRAVADRWGYNPDRYRQW